MKENKEKPYNYDSGYDRFSDGKYNNSKWSAPMLRDYVTLKKYLEGLDIIGNSINEVFCISNAYNLSEDNLEEYCWNEMSKNKEFNKLTEEEKQQATEYRNINNNMLYPRWAELDEPIIISLSNNKNIEICAAEECCYRISANRIPLYAISIRNNVDLNSLFECKGKKIVDIEINRIDSKYESNYLEGARYLSWEENNNYKELDLVESIVFRFQDGYGLKISGSLDFCEIELIDKNNIVVKDSFSNIKQSIYNWTECKTDINTGFVAQSNSFYVNEKGAKCCEEAFMTFHSNDIDSFLTINEFDYDFLYMIISKVHNKEECGIYDDFDLEYDEWISIIESFKKAVSFDTYNELFEYITGCDIKKCQMIDSNYLDYMNVSGAEIWKNLEEYRKQVEDLIEWTKLSIQKGSKVSATGY